MDGHVAQQRMSWRHFYVARLASAIERSHFRLCVVLVLLSLACFLPGFTTLQPMDRDEPRYAQASKQMLETRRFRRYPVPGRGPAQEADRHLLAAGGERRHRRGARRARGAHDDRALPHSLASRRHRDRAADLLGGACLPRTTRRVSRPPPSWRLPSSSWSRRGWRRRTRRSRPAPSPPWAGWPVPISSRGARHPDQANPGVLLARHGGGHPRSRGRSFRCSSAFPRWSCGGARRRAAGC